MAGACWAEHAGILVLLAGVLVQLVRVSRRGD